MAFAGSLLISKERSDSLTSNSPAILHLPGGWMTGKMAGWGTGLLVHDANLVDVQLRKWEWLMLSWARQDLPGLNRVCVDSAGGMQDARYVQQLCIQQHVPPSVQYCKQVYVPCR